MARDKKSFFERLTGTIKLDDESMDFDEPAAPAAEKKSRGNNHASEPKQDWLEEEQEEGELAVDVFQTPNEIFIKTIVAGVRPEDLDISITRDLVVIRGRREEKREVNETDYFHRELYWGGFSRSVTLPEEIEVEEAEASSTHGLLTIRLPKVNKAKQTKLKVKLNQ